MDIKRLFIDTETTGLDPQRHGLIQVAGLVDINGKIEDSFNFQIQPDENKIIDDEALKVNRTTRDELKTFKHSAEIFHLFRQQVKKYINQYDSKDKFSFLAYNAPFDVGFIRQWFLDNGDKYYGSLFFRYPIDVASIAMEALIDQRPTMKNDRLATCIQYFNVTAQGDLHDALTDIVATRDVYYKALAVLKGDAQQELF